MNKKPSLTTFNLVMMTIVSVDSVRNLPAAAKFGSQLIFFYLLAAILFLLPCAYISAELSSTWPKQQGVYGWVKQAFGTKMAVIAIWFQWISNAIWYPAILSFMAATLGFIIDPSLADNRWFLIVVILASFWIATWINLRGIFITAKLSNICSIFGLIIPMCAIIIMGFIWVIQGHTINIPMEASSMLPHINTPSMWVALTGIMLSFCGMEIATVHIKDVQNPQQNFPKALLISCFILLITLLLGSLTLAIVIPSGSMSLVAGIMQAAEQILDIYGLKAYLPIFSFMLILGTLGGVANWIIAPTRGLMLAAEDNLLPTFFTKTNKHNAPVNLLLAQAVLASIFCFVFLLSDSVNGSYWIITVLAAQLYMIMYIIMFITALKLRKKYPNQPRPYEVPGKYIGATILCYLGILGSCLTFVISFIPPTDTIQIGSTIIFEKTLIIGLLVLSSPPLYMIYQANKKNKKIVI